MNPRALRARLQVLAAALLFSTGGAAIKAISLAGGQVAGFRSGIAAVALALLLPASRRNWSRRTLLVAVAYAATLLLFVTATKRTTAANAIFLQSTAPIYLLLIGPWLLREPVRRSDLGFFAAVAIGLALVFLGEEHAVTAPDPVSGNLLALASGLSWAFTVAGLRWLGRDPDPQANSGAAAVLAGNLLGFLLALPWSFPIEGAGAVDALVLAYLGVVQIGCAYAFLVAGLRHVPALEAAILLLVEPVLNPIWAWLAHAEAPSGFALLGGGVILGATAAKSVRDARRGSRPD